MTNIFTAKKLTMVLADADFFIGLYLVEDVHHQKCLWLSENIDEEVITSYDVVDEVVTKLTYFGRKDKAILFLNDVKSTNLSIIFSDRKLAEKAITIFKSQKTKHVSFTDCMNMAIAKEKKIKFILSFDKIYDKNGFKLVK